MSRNPTADLALVVGGMGAQCGLIFSSTDGGLSWRKDSHVNVPGTPVHCDGMPLPDVESAWCRMKTLYGVGIFDEDNTAAAGGYNGQQLRRNAAGDWEDRSRFLSPFVSNWEDGVVYPLYGVDADSGNGSTGRAVLTGMGGYLRDTADGGQTWANSPGVQGTSWRIKDVVFTTLLNGVLVGQHGRISRTGDAGQEWQHMSPLPAPGKGFLNAIAVAADGFRGIAVGNPMVPQGGLNPLPVVLRSPTVTSLSQPWLAGTVPDAAGNRALNDITWAGNLAWCAGNGGLILRSGDAGSSWMLVDVSAQEVAMSTFDIAGVAFLDSTTVSGVFAGQRTVGGPAGPRRGFLYRYFESGSTVSWLDVTPSGVGAPELFLVAAVTISGNTAWAVGDRLGSTGAIESGIVLTSTHTATGFGSFQEVPGIAPPACSLGEEITGHPILSAVAVAPNGDVVVGGQCGFIARKLAAGSTWMELPSKTTSHVRSISIVPNGGSYTIFVGAFRESEEAQCLVVYE